MDDLAPLSPSAEFSPGATFGRLRFVPHARRWVAEALPPHVSMRFKRFFPKIETGRAGALNLPDSPDIATDLLWFMHRFPLEVSDEDWRRLRGDHYERMSQHTFAHKVLSEDWAPPANPVGFRAGLGPWGYQSQAAALASRFGQLLLLDEVGLGKTISALAAIAESQQIPAAVVCQAHLSEQWRDFVDEFTTMRVHEITTTKVYELPPADVYVFRYSNVAAWADVAATGLFKAVVFDEIQELRRGQASEKGRGSAVFADHASLRMGLTATPVYNYGSEAFHIMEYLAPGALGNWSDFETEWCIQDGAHWVVKDPSALGAWLRANHLALRRTEEDVGVQMPPVNTLLHEVPYDTERVADLEKEARELAQVVLSGGFRESGEAARQLDWRLRMATGVGKAESVGALAKVLMATGDPLVMGAWHREVYDIWNAQLAEFNPVMYTGSETTSKKAKMKAAFIAGDSQVLLISLRSGAGLNGLQHRAWRVLHGELDWSPQVHKQLNGRLRRRGQTKQIDSIYAWTNGGSDPVLMETQGLKSSQAHGITDPFLGTPQVFTDDSRMKRLARAYLEGRT